MIKEYPKYTKYGRYFLSFEAPGDEGEEEPVKKPNMKVIDIKPNNRSKKDFTAGDDEDPNEEIEDTPVETDDTTDFASDEDPINTDTTTNTTSETEPQVQGPDIEADVNATNAEIDANNDIDFATDDVEMQTDADAGEEIDGGEEGVDEPDVGGDEDFTGDDTGEEDTTTDTGEEGGEENSSNGPGLEYDSTRKYILFKNFNSLSNAIDNYITKLENNISDNYNINTLIKTSTDKLREINELCYDYMIMKFEISTYIQSLLFYQNLIAMIQACFDMIEKSYQTIKSHESASQKTKH